MTSPAPESHRRLALLTLLALALTVLALTLVFPERLYSTRTLDLRASSTLAPVETRTDATRATFARTTLVRVPRSARLLEDGRPLERVWREPALLTSATWTGEGPALSFASSDGSSPLSSAPVASPHRYELAYEPDTVLALVSLPGAVLLLLLSALFLVAARSGAIALTGPASPRARATLALAVLLVSTAGALKSWNLLYVDPDSEGYATHSAVRPCLYPAFIDVFRYEPAPSTPTPTTPTPTTTTALVPTERLVPSPESPFVRVANAQRLLTALALATLAFSLAGSLNAWLVGALFFLGALLDTERAGGSSSLAFNAGSLMSEGINTPLLFFLVAALQGHLRRPGHARALLVTALLALLLLNRPANVGLLLAVPLVGFASARPLEWRRATLRTLALGLALALPLLAACEKNREQGGRFRLHAFSGPSLLGLSLETATEEDAASLEDPKLRAFLEACVTDPRRQGPRDHEHGDYLNQNVYEVAYPALDRTLAPAPSEKLWAADDAFQTVARLLWRRHPGACLALALEHTAHYVTPRHVALLLALVLALAIWRRTRAPEALFAASLAVLPYVYMLPVCVFNFPSERYRSQVSFAEWLALPFLGVVVLSARLWRRSPPIPEAQP